MPFLQAAIEGPWSWPLLWQITAGAHCLVVPRLLFLLEWQLDDFRNYMMLATAWLLLLGSGVIILRAVWQEKTLDAHSRGLCVFLVFMALGSAQHMNNLAYSFNIQWTLSLFLSLLLIHLVVTAARDGAAASAWRVVSAIVVAVLLVFSNFTLPALLACMLVLLSGLRVRRLFTFAILSGVVIAGFCYIRMLPVAKDVSHLWSVLISGEGSVTGFLSVLQALLHFSLLYMGAPLAELHKSAAVVLASIALLFCGYVFWERRLKGGHLVFEGVLFWLAIGYAAFAFGMAFSTAIGRIVAFDLAFSPRFRTTIMPFLMLVAMLWVCRMQVWSGLARVAGSFVLVILTLIVVLPGHARLLHQFSDEYDQYVTPNIALAVGLTHVDVVHQARVGAFWKTDNEQMLRYRDFLRNYRRAVYATPFFGQLGNKLDVPEKLAQGFSQNVSANVEALPGGGYRWRGYTDQCGSDGRVAVLDANGVVMGSGTVARKLPDDSWRAIYRVLLPLCQSGKPVLWTAFLPANAQSAEKVSAVTFSDNGPVLLAETVLP